MLVENNIIFFKCLTKTNKETQVTKKTKTNLIIFISIFGTDRTYPKIIEHNKIQIKSKIKIIFTIILELENIKHNKS